MKSAKPGTYASFDGSFWNIKHGCYLAIGAALKVSKLYGFAFRQRDLAHGCGYPLHIDQAHHFGVDIGSERIVLPRDFLFALRPGRM